jgi:hypothetical protein
MVVMSLPPPLPPLEQLGQRPFSFYPAIANIEHNEWMYRRSTWSETLVRNTKSGEEVWVPRRFVGEVSRVDEPVMIVGLLKELEYKAGAVWPVERRVIEMPRAVNDWPRPAAHAEPALGPAAVVGIRLSDGAESKIGKIILGGIAVGIAACVLGVSLYRGGVIGNRIIYRPLLQNDLGLNSWDDYHAVVRMLGTPGADHWRSEKGEMQYRILSYPKQGFSIVLAGRDRNDARYIGAVDRDGNPVHSVQMPGNVNSIGLLRALKK